MVLVFCADCKKWYDTYLEAGCTPRKPGAGDLMLAVTDAAIAAQKCSCGGGKLWYWFLHIGDIMENCEEQRRLLKLPGICFSGCDAGVWMANRAAENTDQNQYGLNRSYCT